MSGYGADYNPFTNEPYTSTNYFTQSLNSGNWVTLKRNTAELEAHRERVRQAFVRSFQAVKSSSEWAQGLNYIQNALTVDSLKKVCESFEIIWSDKGDMLTSKEQIAKLKAEIDKLNQQVVKLELGRMGKEPANGTVLKIEKRFSAASSDKYSYAAIKAAGSWFLTGTSGSGTKIYTWEELKTFIGKYSRVWLMAPSKEFVD